MEKVPVFSVIGGDRRHFFAAKYLKDQGYPVETFAMTDGKSYDRCRRTKADKGKQQCG